MATNLVDDFLNTAQGAVSAALRPNFFRVSSQGQLDSYPLGTEVAILLRRRDARRRWPAG
ncbi:MAG: hypothetical protein R3F17_11095 [Planctomycetota bacterium]